MPALRGPADDALRDGGRRPHLAQLDALRLVPMAGVMATHVLLYTAPASSRWAGAVLMVLHVNRELFFFVTAFVLAYATGAAQRSFDPVRFWRRRYPLVVLPYLTWTVLYWVLVTEVQRRAWPSPAALLQDLATGWFQLYFLLVTMQIYLVFPAVAWLVRRTQGWHWLVLLVSAALQLGLDWVFEYRPGSIPGPIFAAALWAEDEVTSYQFYVVAGVVAAAHHAQLIAWARTHRREVGVSAILVLLGGELVYLFNLHVGYLPQGASADLQPALVPMVLAALALLWCGSDWLVETVVQQDAIWRGVRRGADLSFGTFLAHMVPLVILLQPGVIAAVQPIGMSWPQVAAFRYVVVVTTTVGLVALLRRTPLSMPLTGRPRHRRPASLVDAVV